MAVEPASRSQAPSVCRLSRGEPCPRRRRRSRQSRRQPDKLLSRIESSSSRGQRRRIGSPRLPLTGEETEIRQKDDGGGQGRCHHGGQVQMSPPVEKLSLQV